MRDRYKMIGDHPFFISPTIVSWIDLFNGKSIFGTRYTCQPLAEASAIRGCKILKKLVKLLHEIQFKSNQMFNCLRII